MSRYGWRYQIKPWVKLGYRVVAVDKLGYGGSDKPEDAIQYTSRRICDDIAALMDLLQVPKAVSHFHLWTRQDLVTYYDVSLAVDR